MWWTGSNLFISSGKRTRECAVKLRRTRETKSSHFLSSTLLSRLLSRATRAWFLSIFLKWRDWSSAVTVFIMVRDGCIVIIMAQSIPRLPIPPKTFVKCYGTGMALDIWTKADKIAQTLVSQTINSNHFFEICLQLSEKSLLLLILKISRKKQPSSKLKSIPVLS